MSIGRRAMGPSGGRRRRFLPLALLAFIAGCAQLPAVDADIAKANRAADYKGGLDLMRQQDERISHHKFVGGNGIELLLNGKTTYAAMGSIIDQVKQRIDMESYTFDEVEGDKFADALIAKRAQGVEVNLIYDAWGSQDTPKALFDKLRQGGVHVVEYNPLAPAEVLDLNKRDHRKLLIVDGAVAILGGVNVDQVYENRRQPGVHTDDPEKLPWRDTDIRIQGPVVTQFEEEFMATWEQQKGDPIAPPPPTPDTRYGEALIEAIDGSPDDGRPLIYRTLVVAIALAHKSVHLTTGYFVPTPDLAKALRQAAARGVDVTIVVPGHSDSPAALAAGRAAYEDLLEAGVHIYERQGAVLHAKTAVIDGAWSAVGSSNLDWRSVIFNNEIDAIILNEAFGSAMDKMFDQDIARSKLIDRDTWARRPLDERLDECWAKAVEFML
jgi:cardiolipin synthase